MLNNLIDKTLLLLLVTLMSVACVAEHDEPLRYGELSVSLSGEPEVEVLQKKQLVIWYEYIILQM